ncbi:unnamed protein product, partial [Discosporangium mesarthrocarpum]
NSGNTGGVPGKPKGLEAEEEEASLGLLTRGHAHKRTRGDSSSSGEGKEDEEKGAEKKAGGGEEEGNSRGGHTSGRGAGKRARMDAGEDPSSVTAVTAYAAVYGSLVAKRRVEPVVPLSHPLSLYIYIYIYLPISLCAAEPFHQQYAVTALFSFFFSLFFYFLLLFYLSSPLLCSVQYSVPYNGSASHILGGCWWPFS